MKNIIYILLLLSAFVNGQTTTQNYIKTSIYHTETPTSDATKARLGVTYYDGLGRPIQQIAGKASVTGKDIITHTEYDAYGRQFREYLPYGASTSNLAFDTSAQTNTLAFYNNIVYENTANPYSEKFFEPSPLNRVRKQAAPGNIWQGNTSDDNDRTVKYAYSTNASNEVLKLTATATWNAAYGVYDISFVSNGNHAAGQLYKTISTTEDQIGTVPTSPGTLLLPASKRYRTEEFKNKEGQLVLKRKYLLYNLLGVTNTSTLNTYYVYDQYGNLAYVLPPLANGTITKLDDLCFQYKYDDQNRLVEKKLPGKNWEFIVYDAKDRVVATGPANSPYGDGTVGWLHNVYDSFDRLCITSWGAASVHSATRKTWQDANLGAANVLRSTDTDGVIKGYKAAHLVPQNFQLLSVKYYDNYTFPGGPTAPFPDIITQQVLTEVKGLATGSWSRAITTSAETLGETTYILYDKKNRPICIRVTNYLGGYTQTETKFDFDGKTMAVISRHKRLSGNTILTVRDDFYYNAQHKLYRIINGIGSLPKQLMSYNTYDELGQLVVKRVGGVDISGAAALQKVDYTYNIRGWLKGINDVTDLALPSAPQDLFAFKINYTDTPTNNVNGSVQPKFNGNIAETSWRTASDDIQRRYGYEYDNLDKLKSSWYQMPSAVVDLRNSYNEQANYDWNGNITSMKRNGESDDATTTIAIDDLTYTYTGNKLTKVIDGTNHPKGFKDSSDNTGDDYTYYDDGNMKTDKNKGIITPIKYNHLNLPTEIVFNNNSATKITYFYDAEGKKLKKIVKNGAVETITDYISGYQYKNGVLEFFRTSEGYVKSTLPVGGDPNSAVGVTYNYVFNYTDHLGNVRLSYTVDPADGVLKIMDENHYYPFGLKHNGYSATQRLFAYFPSPPYVVLTPVINPGDATYKYKYNGKELQDELGLGWYDYQARNYDPAIGRWMNIDPLAELSRRWSPYSYCYNSPTIFVDPDGMFADLSHEKVDTTLSKGDGWIRQVSEGKSTYTYNASVNTVGEAKAAGYEGALNVLESATIIADNGDYGFDLGANGEVQNIDTKQYVDVGGGITTEGGTTIATSTKSAGGIDINNMVDTAGNVADGVGLGLGVQGAIIDAAIATAEEGSVSVAAKRLSTVTGVLGKLTGIASTASAAYEAYKNPSLGSATKLVVNLALLGARANPVSAVASILVGVMDVTGASDAIYDSIDDGANKLKKMF